MDWKTGYFLKIKSIPLNYILLLIVVVLLVTTSFFVGLALNSKKANVQELIGNSNPQTLGQESTNSSEIVPTSQPSKVVTTPTQSGQPSKQVVKGSSTQAPVQTTQPPTTSTQVQTNQTQSAQPTINVGATAQQISGYLNDAATAKGISDQYWQSYLGYKAEWNSCNGKYSPENSGGVIFSPSEIQSLEAQCKSAAAIPMNSALTNYGGSLNLYRSHLSSAYNKLSSCPNCSSSLWSTYNSLKQLDVPPPSS